MQLDFGFPHLAPPARAVPQRRATAPSQRRQLELRGMDRLQEHTYFFAVLPDDPAATAAGQIARSLAERLRSRGALIQVSRLHVSLTCLCSRSARLLSAEAEAEAIRAAKSVRVGTFELSTARVLSFGRRGGAVAYRRPVVLTFAPSPQLGSLHESLFAALSRAGVVGGRARAFTPHMTLFYESDALLDEPVEPPAWTVRNFHLIHSLHGRSQYQVLASFPLRA